MLLQLSSITLHQKKEKKDSDLKKKKKKADSIMFSDFCIDELYPTHSELR